MQARPAGGGWAMSRHEATLTHPCISSEIVTGVWLRERCAEILVYYI